MSRCFDTDFIIPLFQLFGDILILFLNECIEDWSNSIVFVELFRHFEIITTHIRENGKYSVEGAISFSFLEVIEALPFNCNVFSYFLNGFVDLEIGDIFDFLAEDQYFLKWHRVS